MRLSITCILVGLGATFLLNAVFAQNQATPATRTAPSTSVLTDPADDLQTLRSVTERFTDERFRGLVVPSKEVILNAPRNGKVMTINVEESDEVKQGDALAVMDNRVQHVRVAAAQLRVSQTATLRRALFALQEMQILLDRIQITREQDAAGEWEVRRTQLQRDQAQAAYDAEKENAAQAKEELNLEEEVLEQHVIRAPFDGVVIRIATEAGATLTDSDPIVRLAALDVLEAQLYLPVELFGKLQVGQTYQMLAEEPVSRMLEGKLKTIEPIVDPASRTFRCVFEIANTDKKMPAGFLVRLTWPQP